MLGTSSGLHGVLRRRAGTVAVAGLLLAVLGIWVYAWNFPHFDTYVHLTWGRDLLDGHAPAYTDFVAPTPHPLWLGVATVLAGVFGQGADHAVMLVTLLSWAAMLVAIYRVGASAMSPAVGVLGAVFVGTSATFFFYTTRAYVDIPYVALVLWAAALEADRPRRGVPVMALLALAGLLRPEAWMLAGLYFLWLASGPRTLRALVPSALLVAAAPALWALIDLLVTGDALYSLHRTQAGAEGLGRLRGVEHIPGSLADFFGTIIRRPVAALGGLGALAAVALLGPRRPAVPLAILIVGVGAFFAIGIFELSILPRYVILPSTALALFAGFAVLGWTTLPEAHRLRAPWRIGSIVLLAAGTLALAVFGLNVGQFTDRFAFERAVRADLERLLDHPRVRACSGPITLPGFRLVPEVRWITGARPDQATARVRRRPPDGVEIVIRDPAAYRAFFGQDRLPPRLNEPAPEFRPLATSERFAAFGRCR